LIAIPQVIRRNRHAADDDLGATAAVPEKISKNGCAKVRMR
jgi:hypothetical protein